MVMGEKDQSIPKDMSSQSRAQADPASSHGYLKANGQNLDPEKTTQRPREIPETAESNTSQTDPKLVCSCGLLLFYA